MLAQLRELLPGTNLNRRTSGSRLLIGFLSVLAITAVACGTDRGAEGAAAPFQVDGDTLIWSPPWEEGDSRTVTVIASTEPNDALKMLTSAPDSDIAQLDEEQSGTTGTVTIVSTGSDGSTVRFDFSIEELIRQLEDQTLEQPGFGESDLSQFTGIVGLLGNIDLGVEFGVDNLGAVTGVTNTEELIETVRSLFNSLLRFAALAGEDAITAEDRQKFEDALDAAPETELVRVLGELGLNTATANMFLMRSGEYTVGQPVVLNGRTATFFGLETEGSSSYEVTEIGADTVTVEVMVSPTEFDVMAMFERLTLELASLAGEDTEEITEDFADLEPDERAIVDALLPLLFEPYTVTLTLDSETGWVTNADWSVDLALPEGLEDLVPEEDREFDDEFADLQLSDLEMTLRMSAVFEESSDG